MELTAEEKKLEEEAKKLQKEEPEQAESSDDEKEENKEEGGDPEAKKKKKKKKNKKKKKAADEPTTANEPEKGVDLDLEKMKQEDVHPPTQTNEIFRCLGAWTVPSKHKFPNNQFQGYGPN
jgi:hypothetical protein